MRVQIYHHYGIKSSDHYLDGLLGSKPIMVAYRDPLGQKGTPRDTLARVHGFRVLGALSGLYMP